MFHNNSLLFVVIVVFKIVGIYIVSDRKYVMLTTNATKLEVIVAVVRDDFDIPLIIVIM